MSYLSFQRLLIYLSVVAGASIFWIAPHPPMVDLPQHAGQIALLHDLVLNQSAWAKLVRINLFTPYLLGYGLALPFTFLFSVSVAIKIVLSLAFILFVGVARAMREWCGGDERLDWLFLIGFFGFSYNLGLYTFLVAAPVALMLILQCAKYAVSPTRAHALRVVLTGLILLASHGLSFVFACGVGGVIYLINARSIKEFLRHMWPFILLAIACCVYFVISKITEAEIAAPYGTHVSWKLGIHRVHEVVLHSFGIAPKGVFLAAATIMICFPWLLGMRFRFDRAIGLAMLLVVVCISLFIPSFALKTALLYQRFAIFLLPAYALCFAPANATSIVPPLVAKVHQVVLMPLVILSCWAVLGSYAIEAHRFANESANIDAALQRIEPGSRALALVASTESDSIANRFVYGNYVSWYQAEHKGFVDFNFAWFPPQIVRFRPDQAPPVDIDFEPANFDWSKHHGEQYRYFVVRQPASADAALFKGAACKPTMIESVSNWRIYERSICNTINDAMERAANGSH